MTTELSKLLTSCLTAVKKHVIKYCEKGSGKNLFWSIKNSGEILDKLKARDFNATSLSTYDFSTLYTTLPHNLIKDKLIDHIERTFQEEGSPYLACNDRNAFFTLEKTKAAFLDLHLCSSNKKVSSKIYDKRDDFDYEIVNFPFLDGDVPHTKSYGVYISQLIRLLEHLAILLNSTLAINC